MTTTQTIVWIALPNGYAGEAPERRLRLSVFVAPRLRSDAGSTLALYPDFLDWAARLGPDVTSFALEVDDGTVVPATVVSEPPDPLLWAAFFRGDTPVRPFQFDDYADRPIVSYPVRDVLNFVKRVYRETAAASPTDLPRIAPDPDDPERGPALTQLFRELIHGPHREIMRVPDEATLTERLGSSLERARQQARARRAAGQRGGALIEPPSFAAAGTPSDSFYRTMLFHYRPAKAEPVDLPASEDEAAALFTAEFDFHQMLTALGDYPALLRRLGLVFDLEVPDGALPASDNEFAARKVRVNATWASNFAPLPADPGALNVSPWTVYALAALNGQDLFIPWPTRDAGAGMWLPVAGAVDVVQVDADGAALRTLHQVNSIDRLTDGRPVAIDAPERDGLGALRSSGLAIVQIGRAAAMAEDFNRSLTLNTLLEQNPPAPADLRAEDVQRGYRLDVQDVTTGLWYSLHRRVGTFNPLDDARGPFDLADEGFTQPSAATPAEKPGTPPDPNAELYIHEALFTWDGWSLSAPRPGKALSRSPRAPSPDEPGTEPDYVPNKAMTALRLETSFRPQDGSLPRLRYGRPYRLRVRAVDLAGNGPTVDEATAMLDRLAGMLQPVLPADREALYSRFEPVNPPEIVPRVEFTEGESAARLVIRSDFDRSAETYAAEHPPYAAVNERHVVAPKAALAQIEAHGLLDAAFDAKPGALTEEEVRAIRREVYELARREAGSLTDTSLPTVIFVPTSAEDPTQGYAVHTEEQLELPYLPDPWSAGVVFQGLPGTAPGQLTTIVWGGLAWPKATPFRLQLAEGDAPPQWDEAARVLTVFLPGSGVATVRVSSLFGGDLSQVGLWRWLEEAVKAGEMAPARLDEIGAAAKEGRHWMFTPFHELTLIHATQHPLAQPEFLDLTAERPYGQTIAYLTGAIDLHAPSTAKIDLLATWKEPRDDPAAPAPDTVDGQAHVMEIPIDLRNQPIAVPHLEAPGRYVLLLEDDRLLTFDAHGCAIVAQDIRWRQANEPPPPLHEADRREKRRLLAEKIAAHDFGDTKYRRVRYRPAATSRFREYFPPTLWDDLSRTGAEMELDILASARPAAPQLRYALPTFGWTAEDDGATASSRRLGGGVRLYLERPWFSSGDGELLAVVLGQGVPDPRDHLYRYSTFWGQDPLWVSPPLELPRPAAFRNADLVETRVALGELTNRFVTVVGFVPRYDESRGLWTVDLDLPTAGHYFPFIRLALARFQPRALSDVRLSSVMLADFVQTAPDRLLTVARDAGGPGVHRIHVSGAGYTARRAFNRVAVHAAARVVARLERRRPDIADETLGWAAVAEAAEVALTPGAVDADGTRHWQGDIAVPEAAAGEMLRLVVREEEVYENTSAGRPVYVDIVAL
ncbi:MAG: hypothetical protein KIT52_11290 [Anaerolineae bacterium]|nr:hypothetical protein [Anaerolineae bacterium]